MESTFIISGHSYIELRGLIEYKDRIESVKDKKSVFYCSSLVVIVNVVLFVNLEATGTSSQQPSAVSNLNVSSTTPDMIDETVNGMATKNIDKLMSETIIPALTNSSSSRIIITGNNQTAGGTSLSLGTSSDTFSNNQNQKNARVQNGPILTNVDGSAANNARAIADNGTILLQFQNPTDIDIVNRLERIETIIQKYIMRNDANTTAKSIQESNNRILNELSGIKSSISGSSVLPAVTAKSIQESNNRILNELSEIKSSISGSISSNLFSAIISGALVAAIVSAVAFFVLLRVYSNGGIKLSELKLKRRNSSNYT
ncbi:MAG TPA: hypothetical protein VFS97_12280 [Nitrososphaeraceae archaeon]|nr:hypothetical protein [Nitrososphaeraceae archaeon]